jgi:hypothetical protein
MKKPRSHDFEHSFYDSVTQPISAKTRKFLKKFVRNIAEQCIQEYDRWDDHISYRQEKQLQGVALKAASNIKNAVAMIEAPHKKIKLKIEKQSPEQRYVDLIIDLKSKHSRRAYLMELKHAEYYMSEGAIRRWVMDDRWLIVHKQLSHIDDTNIDYMFASKNIYDEVCKMAVMFVVGYQDVPKHDHFTRLHEYHSDLKKRFRECLKIHGSARKTQHKLEPNWYASWMLPKNKNCDGRYPCLHFIGRIERM